MTVVKRCTACGHSAAEGTSRCGACNGDVGYWCHAHEGDAGWLPDGNCPACAEDKRIAAERRRAAVEARRRAEREAEEAEARRKASALERARVLEREALKEARAVEAQIRRERVRRAISGLRALPLVLIVVLIGVFALRPRVVTGPLHDIVLAVDWPAWVYVAGARSGIDLGDPPELNVADAALAAGFEAQALRILAGAAARYRDPQYYRRLAALFLEFGDPLNAGFHLQQAVDLSRDPATLRDLGALHLQMARRAYHEGDAESVTRHYEVARQYLVAAIRADRDDRYAYGYLACALAELGRYPEAESFLRRAGPGPWHACGSSRG